jgi:hypothetical protein
MILYEKGVILLSLTIFLDGSMNIVSVQNVNDELESLLRNRTLV